jgi:phasin family protein
MASKKTTKASATPKATATSASPDVALTLSQDQLQALIGLTDVFFKGAEEMRRFQMEAAHQARERHEQAQALVAKARTPAELFELQSELLRFDLESSGRYWQQLAAICAETQANTLDLFNRSAATVGVDLAKLVVPAPAEAEAKPETPATPLGVEAANQAWNQWIDLGKQWTDMVYRTEAALH